MQLFNSVQQNRPRLNKFDLSHERKLTANMGVLTPIYVQDVVPGDKFRVSTEIMMRLAPMLAPVMHRMNVFVHYFFVPNRLVWNEWEDFITGGPDGTLAPVHPFVTIDDATKNYFGHGSLSDHMGVPYVDPANIITNETNISTLPFRAYQTIYNEYYRDQNLQQTPVVVPLTSGEDNAAAFAILATTRKRAWEKDYFTSALPFAQRGAPVTMPIEATGTASTPYISFSGAPPDGDTKIISVGLEDRLGDVAGNTLVPNDWTVAIDSSSITINDLRRSVKLQEWLEKNARGGARYIEQILVHFGVLSSDARLQRPEYLGGGKQPIVISEVLSTVDYDGSKPQGNMSGHGLSVGRSNGFARRFEEHGYVIGIMSVLPRTAYQQGIPRHLQKFDKFDIFWPTFANLGEQEINYKEIYYDAGGVSTVTPFGYQSRYSEYKYMPSTVHGEFKSTLAYWHMGRIFAAEPDLNEDFVMSDPTTRIFAVEEGPEDYLWIQLFNRVDALRPMPYFGTPTL